MTSKRAQFLEAIRSGSFQVVLSMLVGENTDEQQQQQLANATDSIGISALHEAVERADGGGAIIEMLLRFKADPKAQSSDGRTALHLAAFRGNNEAALLLINAEPSLVHIADTERNLPLHDAALKDRGALCSLLLERGGEGGKSTTNVKNRRGQTPKQVAQGRNSSRQAF